MSAALAARYDGACSAVSARLRASRRQARLGRAEPEPAALLPLQPVTHTKESPHVCGALAAHNGAPPREAGPC